MKNLHTEIVGEYSHCGYCVYSYPGPNLEYSAGNYYGDSATYVEPGTHGALPLRKIRSYCLKTTKEIAQELGVEVYHIERMEDET